jgi:hypothetical protein
VSRSLHRWIDLIWSVDQRPASRDNVYDWHLYRRAWTYQNINPTELIAFMRLVGQIPPKLFREPIRGRGSGDLDIVRYARLCWALPISRESLSIGCPGR